ncbi:leucine-rich repeats and immunoglobulin-like domains protein 3 [Prorops nasuta]|uniref:leucine-rich repeats and immunoglobulin-like domains protein 3 n=1 Tax=Prorops nasuta TaxID=863751 RepID=UPI0034CDB5A2
MSNWENAFSLGRRTKRTSRSGIFAFIFLLICNSLSGIFVADAGEADQCPIKCSCLGNIVDCRDLKLNEAPSGLPPWTETLDVSVNRLGDDFRLALSNNDTLKVLKVNKNQLTKVPDLTFAPNLYRLSLSHNSITSINGTALLTLPNLINLDLSGNNITVLQRGFFLAPNQLLHLHLNSNQIKIIENGSLDNLTSLEELRLNKNHLTHIKDLFSNLKRLRILELNRNELRQIRGLSFKGLENLEELRLTKNKIDKLEDGAFYPLPNLFYLQLDFNQLTSVKKGGLWGLNHLDKLTLSHNRISMIDHQAWESCRNITELDLSHNEFTSIERDAFEFLDKLETLNFDHNQITYISDTAFRFTPNLRVLELNANRISYTVEDTNKAFGPLGNLFKLGLAHNRIKSVNQKAFVGLRNVTELDLTGNNITNIQENAFDSMPNLIKLKMNSRSLVCDCGLQWLSVWLRRNMLSSDAKVHCGYPAWLERMPLTQLHHTNFTCDDYPKPRIIQEPVGQMSIKGDNVTLVCRANSTANAPLHFTWKHDNVEMKKRDFQNDVSTSENGVTEVTSTLTIFNVTHAHAGKYQCMVTNNYGTTYSAKVKLSVLIFPSFSKIPKDIEVMAGSTANLECSAEGLPAPQIAWQKDGGNDFPAARERRMYMMPTDDVLFIINAKAADGGIYSCTAQNLAGLIIANATLTILETPSFVKPMENKEITVGGSIVLECMAGGSPKPKLSWRKDGSPLQATERHFFTAEDQLLIIVNTILSDAGSYECEMTNSQGTVVDASNLTVNPGKYFFVIDSPSSLVNEDDILGLIIITVVCCAVGTSVVWVVIIYQTRRRLSASHNTNSQPVTSILPIVTETQTHLFLDTSSQHSKDSGTGDSTNPSSDQLQLCLPEEAMARQINSEDETAIVTVGDPLLHYTNHERKLPKDSDEYEV